MAETLLYKYLKELLDIPSPTGYTKQIEKYILKVLDSLEVDYKVGKKGNILVTLKGKESTNVTTFATHLDTLGAMVKNIKDNGRIEISLIGDYVSSTIEGENCKIYTKDKRIYEGTAQNIKPSIHVFGQEAEDIKRTVENYEIAIDEDVNSKEDVSNLGIQVGDMISFDPRTKISTSGFIKSRYLDDKASVAVVLYVINYIKINEIDLNQTVNFLFTNYEEVCHGASCFIPNNTTNFIAIDLGCIGENQNSTEFDVSICCKDSNGPYDYELINEIVNICKENYISYKLDVYDNYGSDAAAAIGAGLDSKFGLIGPGIYSSHGYERTNIKSLIETTNLILKYMMK